MRYEIFRLRFNAPVHFGNGRLNGSIYTFCADTLFSAMYKEAVNLYGENNADRLRTLALDGGLFISDAMPYRGGNLYLPKPIIHIAGTRESDSSMKKKFKRLCYIPLRDMDAYMTGSYDPSAALEEIQGIGAAGTSAKAAVFTDKDSVPYDVGIFTFDSAGGYGLYFICGGTDEALGMVNELVGSLSYTGIGGKVSAGYGRFVYTREEIPAEMKTALEGDYSHYMSLSISMGADKEQTEKAVSGSYYELVKRSGFVSSETFSDNQVKKRDMYCFKSGSCFAERFRGGIFDVSGGGRHPVYRYAMPVLYGFDREGERT